MVCLTVCPIQTAQTRHEDSRPRHESLAGRLQSSRMPGPINCCRRRGGNLRTFPELVPETAEGCHAGTCSHHNLKRLDIQLQGHDDHRGPTLQRAVWQGSRLSGEVHNLWRDSIGTSLLGKASEDEWYFARTQSPACGWQRLTPRLTIGACESQRPFFPKCHVWRR